MEKDFFHIYQLWKMFRRKRNQIAAHAQKGDKCPLISRLSPRLGTKRGGTRYWESVAINNFLTRYF